MFHQNKLFFPIIYIYKFRLLFSIQDCQYYDKDLLLD